MTEPVADVPERWPVVEREVVHETTRVVSVRREVVQPPAARDRFVRDVVVHPGAAPRYALITSFESGPVLERWIDANRTPVLH